MKQQPTAVSTAVAAAVATIVPDVARFTECGLQAATEEGSKIVRVEFYLLALRDASYGTYELARTAFIAGAKTPTERFPSGYARPDDLWSRDVAIPLAHHGIEKPQSPTSSAARPKTAEQQAKADASKAAAEALAKMSAKDVKAEIDTGKATPERLAKLYPALLVAEKREVSAEKKAIKDDLSKMLKSCTDILKTFNKAQLTKAHTALAKLVPATPSGK